MQYPDFNNLYKQQTRERILKEFIPYMKSPVSFWNENFYKDLHSYHLSSIAKAVKKFKKQT